MPEFLLRDIRLQIPAEGLHGGLERALTTGRYEGQEADAILRHLAPGDRFLDLGAGLGFLCCLAARVLGAAQVTGVEAGPQTVQLARANLDRNGFSAVRLMQGAVVGAATAETADGVEFGQRPGFWASALKGPGDWPKNAQVVRVPALPLVPLLAEVRPSVLCCDIEGAEVAVLAQPLPPRLRLIVVEIHPGAYGLAGTRALFDGLSAQGFAFTPEGSRGATVVFQRLD